MKKKIQLGIVEDDPNYRQEIQSRLSKNFEALYFGSAEEFLRSTETIKYDLVFADIGLPKMNGIELVGILITKFPKMKIIILSGMDSDELIFKSIRFGAIGFIHKSDLKDINEVVENVLEGGAVISPTIAVRVLHSFRGDPQEIENEELSFREKQILNQILSGLSTKECAEASGVTENTLRTHIRNIYKKLQVKNRIELVRRAAEFGSF